jgi:hypothetical protein
MKNIQLLSTLVVLNFMAVSMAYAGVNLKFKAESFGVNQQDLTLFEAGTSPYCQEPNAAGWSKSFSLIQGQEERVIELEEGTPFCIKIKDHGQWGFEDEEAFYGPFISSEECVLSNEDPKPFITRASAHVYPPSADCLLREDDSSGQSYNIFNLSALNDPALPFPPIGKKYDVEIRKMGDTELCQSDRGERIYHNMFMQVNHHGTPSFYNLHTNIMSQDDFCVVMDDVKAGPFGNSTDQKNSESMCELKYIDRGFYTGVYANDFCASASMISFKNTKDATGSETKTLVEIFAAEQSQQCAANGERGKRIAHFEFWPDQVQNFRIDKILEQDAKGKFCLEISKGNDNTTFYGPFAAITGCKLTVGSNNKVTDVIDELNTCKEVK